MDMLFCFFKLFPMVGKGLSCFYKMYRVNNLKKKTYTSCGLRELDLGGICFEGWYKSSGWRVRCRGYVVPGARGKVAGCVWAGGMPCLSAGIDLCPFLAGACEDAVGMVSLIAM